MLERFSNRDQTKCNSQEGSFMFVLKSCGKQALKGNLLCKNSFAVVLHCNIMTCCQNVFYAASGIAQIRKVSF